MHTAWRDCSGMLSHLVPPRPGRRSRRRRLRCRTARGGGKRRRRWRRRARRHASASRTRWSTGGKDFLKKLLSNGKVRMDSILPECLRLRGSKKKFDANKTFLFTFPTLLLPFKTAKTFSWDILKRFCFSLSIIGLTVTRSVAHSGWCSSGQWVGHTQTPCSHRAPCLQRTSWHRSGRNENR